MVTHQDGLSHIKSHDPLTVSSKSRDILNPFYLHYTIPLDTKPGRMGTYCKRLLPLKSYDALITWPTWGHMAFRKIYISIFTILVTTKLDMVLTYCQASARQRLIHHRLFIFFLMFKTTDLKYSWKSLLKTLLNEHADFQPANLLIIAKDNPLMRAFLGMIHE